MNLALASKMSFPLFVLLFITLKIANAIECDHSKTTCEIWLTIEEKLTMTWGKVRVIAQNGNLFRFNETPSLNNTKIPLDDVITMDGYPRSVVAVNGSVPGPPIIAYENQSLIVHVRNDLISDGITVHWHGLHMRETPFMDGVAFITQCPINAGQSFTYRFKAYPSGTFWYHSHIGGQRVDGLFGGLIIKRKSEISNGITDMIMHAGDWFHVAGSTLHERMVREHHKKEHGFQHARHFDGIHFMPAIFESAHIEGRGRYTNYKTGLTIESPMKKYDVKYGSTYRFRLINPGMLYPFRVSIDQHPLVVVSTDGYNVQPRSFESIVINPGERYDFFLYANQTIDNYWIRVDGMEVGYPDHNARGILQYKKSSDLPNSVRTPCSIEKPCHVLNCHFKFYRNNKNTICVKIDELKSTETYKVPKYDTSSTELFQNWVQVPGGFAVNGIIFEHKNIKSSSRNKLSMDCDNAHCEHEKVCRCHHVVELPYDKTIQIIFTNHGKGATRHHPIHIHGHSFHVLKLAYGKYNMTTALKTADNSDIDCQPDKLCNNPKFTNNSWTGNVIPGLNLIDPPEKDTIIVPSGAYAVLRIRSNNPGKWFLHCHIGFHAMQGMALVLNEAKNHQISPPKGFPSPDFHRDIDFNNVEGNFSMIYNDDKDFLLIIVIILAIAITLQTIGIFAIILCRSNKWKKREK